MSIPAQSTGTLVPYFNEHLPTDLSKLIEKFCAADKFTADFGSVDCMTVSRDGKYLFASTDKHLIVQWSVVTGEVVWVYDDFGDEVEQIIVSADTKYVFLRADSMIVQFCVTTKTLVRIVKERHDTPARMILSSTALFVAYENNVKKYIVDTGVCDTTFVCDQKVYRSCVLSSDESKIALLTLPEQADSEIQIRSALNGELLQSRMFPDPIERIDNFVGDTVLFEADTFHQWNLISDTVLNVMKTVTFHHGNTNNLNWMCDASGTRFFDIVHDFLQCHSVATGESRHLYRLNEQPASTKHRLAVSDAANSVFFTTEKGIIRRVSYDAPPLKEEEEKKETQNSQDKKPRSGYGAFALCVMKQVRAELEAKRGGHVSKADVMRVVAAQWSELSTDEQAAWKARFRQVE